jgi:L-threonylcarbamoyladenylate synthase
VPDAALSQSKVHSEHQRIVRSTMPADPAAYGQLLYATLRRLDAAHFDRLLAESTPNTTAWLAVADRLQRASYRA